MSGRHRKAFSNLQSCLTDSSSILLILLINLIQYKFEKSTSKGEYRHFRFGDLGGGGVKSYMVI